MVWHHKMSEVHLLLSLNGTWKSHFFKKPQFLLVKDNHWKPRSDYLVYSLPFLNTYVYKNLYIKKPWLHIKASNFNPKSSCPFSFHVCKHSSTVKNLVLIMHNICLINLLFAQCYHSLNFGNWLFCLPFHPSHNPIVPRHLTSLIASGHTENMSPESSMPFFFSVLCSWAP